MSQDAAAPIALSRVATGIDGLDAIVGGGLFRGALYVVAGVPGAGKTILANQICFSGAARGLKAAYVTLLTESHGRMLAQMRTLSFFDDAKVGHAVLYLNGFAAMEAEGLGGLLNVLRGAVRGHGAELLVLDGMVSAGATDPAHVEYKKFINELQTWAGMFGCTVLMLTSTSGSALPAESTMVDGIFELRVIRSGSTSERRIRVAKFRASAFTEGEHSYLIDSSGIRIFPRLEAHAATAPRSAGGRRVSSGVPGLDGILGGGIPEYSTTLLLGPSGCGKTTMGMQFLVDAARNGGRALHFGFFERPEDLCAKGDRLGYGLSGLVEAGKVEILWRRPAEQLLDQLGYDLLGAVDRVGATRLFIDGLPGIKAAVEPRFPGFFSTLAEALAERGVTTVITEEMRELFVQEVQVPTTGVSAIFHNILFLRNVETGRALTRILAVMKTRDAAADRRPHEYEISARGVRIGRPLVGSKDAIARGKAKTRRLVAPRRRR